MSTEARRDYLRQHIGDEDVLKTVSTWFDALEKQTDFQRRVLEELPRLLIVVDRCGRIVQFNRACEQITGYSAAEILEHHIWEILTVPEVHQVVKGLFDDLQPNSILPESEFPWMTKTDGERIIQWSNSMLLDDAGAVQFVVSTGKDVTEERRLQEMERELTEAQLRILYEHAPVGIALMDFASGGLTIVNPAIVKILGYSVDEHRHITIDSYTYPDDLVIEKSLIAEVFANQRDVYHLEKRYIHKDGHLVWGNFIGGVIRNSLGAPIYGMGILEDISERKETEQQLIALLEKTQQTDKLYHLIADNVTDIIVIITPDLSLSFISPACYARLGYQPEEILSIDSFGLIHPDDEAVTRALLASLNQDNQSLVLNTRVRHKSGRYVWLETNLRVVLNPDESVQEIIGIARDVSERKEYEDALSLSNQELEAFTSSVSHDLRAPLRAMEGFSRMLLDMHAEQMPPDAQRYLSLLRENALQMGRLITDLLTFSKLSRQPILRRQIDMTALALELFSQIDLNRRVVNFMIDDLPQAEGDLTLLRMVFDNLLRNAVKFSANRDVAVIEVGWDNENGEIVYWVKDNGVGFNMEYAHKLFHVFQRLHRAEDYEGTGIGLATVERIIQRHGGRVWAQAEPDKGATFYFVLRGK